MTRTKVTEITALIDFLLDFNMLVAGKLVNITMILIQ